MTHCPLSRSIRPETVEYSVFLSRKEREILT